MYAEHYDDAPIETRHIWILDEEQYEEYIKPFPIWHYVRSVLLLLFVSPFLIIPSMQDISPYEISVPVRIVPQMFSTGVSIVPTGVITVPAIAAHGWITVYNGSILAQQLPQGFIVESASGVEFVTDSAATIPAGNPPSYGIARVSAHAVVPGLVGNVGALTINTVYGTSLYLKNAASFSGGADSYTVSVATDSDKQHALESAKGMLDIRIYGRWLNAPCGENVTVQALVMTVVWSCQFVRYTVPAGLHVLSVQRVGNHIILQVSR